jgi:type III restriction enzyme
VLVLKEGWDVKNVTTIVGLRAYASKSNILPEQTLGRGLRRMYRGSDVAETVSVLGTPAFMEFVESIQTEGVTLERVAMGVGADRKQSLVVEVDPAKAGDAAVLDRLDIEIPKLSRRYHREFKNLDALDESKLGNPRLLLKPFTAEETREIVFKTLLDGEIDHTVTLDGAGPADYRSVVGFFSRQLLKDLRLVGGYDVLYPKVKSFVRDHLFEGSPVDLEDAVVLRNLSEPEPGKILFDAFKAGINALTIEARGTTRIEDRIRLRDVRPFRTDPRGYLAPKRSLFNKIVGEPNAGQLELDFAAFLDTAPGVVAFAKNYFAVGFQLDYVKANGELASYVPDFLVKTEDGTVYVIETKGREELDLPQKMARLRDWCADATAASQSEGAAGGPAYCFVYVDQESFEKHRPTTFPGLVETFREYQT